MQLIAMERRPSRRPDQDPRGWWQYALRLTIGRGSGFRLNKEVMRRCIECRARYVKLVRQRMERAAEDDESALFYLPDTDANEMMAIEEELPLEALVVFRQLARRERVRDAIEQQRRRSSAGGGRTWWGWISGEAGDGAVEPDDVSIRSLEASWVDVGSSDSAKSFMLRLSIVSSATLLLSESHSPIVLANMDMAVSLDAKSESITAQFSIGSLCVEDHCTADPIIKNIVEVQRDSPSEEKDTSSTFAVRYLQAGGNTRVKVEALPLEFTLNKAPIQRLLGFFASLAVDDVNFMRKRSGMGQPFKKKKRSKVKEEGFEVTFEAEAPKIIIPEESCVDKGYLLLDTGHLIVVGHLGLKGMEWNVVLTNVNAGMPHSARDLYGFRDDNVYLIRPFDVSVQVQTVDRESSDMVVDIFIKPNLTGVIDALKLAKILHISRLMTSTFTEQANTESSRQVNLGWDALQLNDVDLTRVLMLVRVKIQEVSLHLEYGSAAEDHLLLSVRGLDVKYFGRQLDTNIVIDLNSIKIDDCSRAPSQRTLAWTPAANQNLIKFSYTFIRSVKSPVYLNHASEVLINFAHLALNVDAAAVLNLRPFVLTLLGKDSYSRESLQSYVRAAPNGKTQATQGVDHPYGMRIVLSIDTITLFLLRKRNCVLVKSESLLEEAFSTNVLDLRSEIILTDLVQTDVKIRSLEVNDQRQISRDFFYKTLFSISPAVDGLSDEDEREWLAVTFQQVSRTFSACEVSIPHLSGFLSLDAVLDLTDLAVASAMAFLSLNSSPEEDDVALLTQLNESLAMNTIVNLPSPRITFLDDPTIESSSAILCRCGIVANHARQLSLLDTGVEIKESLLVNLQRLEVFTIECLEKMRPYQILDPFGVEFNMRRRLERNIVVTNDMGLDIDDINFKLSLRDVLLAQSILTRRALSISAEDVADDDDAVIPKVAATTYAPPTLAQVTAYTFRVSSGELNMVLINDYYGQSVPFLRVTLSGLTLSAGGLIRQLGGTGSVMSTLEYYNSKLSLWEPILERWLLCASLESSTEEVSLSLSSPHTMQITATGAMLEKFLQSYSLFIKAESSSLPSESAPEVSLLNLLGQDVDIEVVDALFNEVLARAPGGEGKAVPLSLRLEQDGRSYRMPKAVNIHFNGTLASERLPLLQLPFKITEPRTYSLQLAPALHEVMGGYRDPVVVEYYQNQRFDPLLREWRLPFLPMDPPADSNVKGKPTRKHVEALDQGWEWLGDWIVDMRGEEGLEIDPDGWEYGASFAALCVEKPKQRRTRKPMDSVRRRRLIRTKVHRSSDASDRSQPLNVIWSIEQVQDGSRIITMRPVIQFENKLPYELMLSLHHQSMPEPMELGPIKAGGIYHVPLLRQFVSSAKIRPVNDPGAWSAAFMCSTLPYDYKTKHDLECSSNEAAPYFIEVHASQRNKALKITFATYAAISNWLPFQVRFRCSSNRGYSEMGSLEPGASSLLSHINTHYGAKVSLQASELSWSDSVGIDTTTVTDTRVVLYNSQGTSSLVVFLQTLIDKDSKSVTLVLYSPAALIDRTGLDLCVWTKTEEGVEMLRTTYSTGRATEGNSTYDGCNNKPVVLANLKIDSQRPYCCMTADIGSSVYVDRLQQWSILPAFLRGQTMVSTSCDDAAIKSKAYMQFAVQQEFMDESGQSVLRGQEAVVFLLFDLRRETPPQWVRLYGFQQIPRVHCIGRLFNFKADAEEIHFTLYAKIIPAGEQVVLSGNWGKGKSYSMYSVFVVSTACDGPGMRDILIALNFEKYFDESSIAKSWVDGGNGLTLFTPEAETVQVGVHRGAIFSEELKIGPNRPAVGSFEVVDWETRRAFQLTYKIESMLGGFNRTRLMYLVPRYMVVNCIEEVLEIRQSKSRYLVRVNPWSAEGWHKTDASLDFNLQFKLGGSMWSRTKVDINEIGTCTFILPPPNGASVHSVPVVLNVEVRQAERDEMSSVVVVVQRARIDGSATLSVRNDTDVSLSVIQSETNLSVSEQRSFEVLLTHLSVIGLMTMFYVDYGAS